MPLDPRTFLGHCLANTADPGDIDDWVAAWHTSSTEMALHSYLGLTQEEYGNWVAAPEVLEHILHIRRLVESSRCALIATVASMQGRLN